MVSWSVTDRCRRHKCLSGHDRCTWRSARVVRLVHGRDGNRSHTPRRTDPCNRQDTCIAPRSLPVGAHPTSRRRATRQLSEIHRRCSWNLIKKQASKYNRTLRKDSHWGFQTTSHKHIHKRAIVAISNETEIINRSWHKSCHISASGFDRQNFL